MNAWMAVCAISLVANAWLLGVCLRRTRRGSARNTARDSEREIRSAAVAAAGAEEMAKLSKALAAAQADLRSLADSPMVGVFGWEYAETPGAEADARVQASEDRRLPGLANAAFRGMMGIPVPESTDPNAGGGMEIPCLLPASVFGDLEIQALRNRGRCGPFEAELPRADGTKASLVMAAELQPGYPARAICLAIDVTRFREAKRELRRSEDRYRALAEGSPVGIWNIRVDGRTVYINPSMADVLELESPADLTASAIHYRDFFTPDSLEIMRIEHAKRARGKGSNYEVEVVGRWGKRTRMVVYGTPVTAQDGTMESLMGTFLDITERKREEEALRQSEERLRVAAECGSDLIYEWDLGTGKVDWFGPVEQRLGFSPAEIPRSREAFERLIHPEDRAGVGSSMERHMRSRERFFQEYRIRCKDGSYRLWSERGTALWDAAGIPGKWIGSASDVTEARRAEDTLRVKEEQLRQSQKLEAVGRLAGGIAHDFNNLLAAIMGYCELMLLRLEPEHICRKEVGEILNGSERAAGLIRQLLAFSRQQIPQPKVIEPGSVIRSMERMLRHLLEENIDLRLHMDEETGRVRMDPVQMEQVVMNLILNARDAMPGGGTLLISTGNVHLKGEILSLIHI